MRALSALLVCALTLSGCLADDPEDPTDGPGAAADTPEVPSEHGTPDRTDSQVQVTRDGDRYRASKVVTILNGAGDATRATLSMETTNGGIAATGWDQGGYVLTATLFADADNEQDAREALQEMRLIASDDLAGDTLALGFRVEREGPGGAPSIINIGGNNNINTGGSLVLLTPSVLSYDADLDGTNGGIAVNGMTGERLLGSVTNGGIEVAGRFDTLSLDNTNGGIAVSVPVGSDYGYDVSATNTNGGIEIRLPDTEPVGPQDEGDAEHVRTRDFEDRRFQSVMDLSNTNGGVVVFGS